METQELWEAILSEIQLSVSPVAFKTWFSQTCPLNLFPKENLLEIGCPTALNRDFLIQRHAGQIKEILTHLTGQNFELSFKVLPKKVDGKHKGPLFAQLLNEPKPQEKRNYETNLSPSKTFENFIVGPTNQMAYAAACAVAKTPGVAYDPLFIYGGVGVGKTHLLQAIGNSQLKNFPSLKVYYITCEKFTNEFIEALSEHKIRSFRAKYRKLDCLLIDDIQGISGRVQTQEEFFHTFNELLQNQGQVVLACDHHPRELSKLTDRLVSRFLGGLICDIGLPDFETRLGILKQKCQGKKLELEDEVLEFLAAEFVGSPRELEGAISKLSTFMNFQNETPTLERVKKFFGQKKVTPKNIPPQKALSAIAVHFNLKIKDLISQKRTHQLVQARQLAAYFLRQELGLTLDKIGEILGKRDHSTILYSFSKMENLLKHDNKLKEDLMLIRESLQGEVGNFSPKT